MAKTLFAIIICLGLAAPLGAAAPTTPKPAKPDWTELTPAQQKVLEPLKEDWGSLDTTRRKKWVKVADKYPKMKAVQQQRLQAQMKEWVRLTPEQRRAAREKYLAVKKLPPDKRAKLKTQWEQYQRSLAAKSDTLAPDDAGAVSTH